MAAAICFLLWHLHLVPSLPTFFDLAPGYTPIVSPDTQVTAVALVMVCLTTGITLNCCGGRRSLIINGGVFILVIVSGIVGLRIFSLDIQTVLLLCGGFLSVLLVQLNRLWQMDRRLTNRILSWLANIGARNVSASTRLNSGLKLLQTVLPLREAIVFQCDDSFLRTTARLKGPNGDQTSNRNSVWREGIDLCKRAITKGELVIATTTDLPTAIVAVPLNHENETIGVLLLRLATTFNEEDRRLLEAVGSQFARNLKRERVSKERAVSPFFSFFSHTGARTKLDAVDVLTAALAEQRCEANALNMIDDGIAIAHLDGTIAIANPQLQRFTETDEEELMRGDIFALLDHFRAGVFDEPAIAVRRVLQSGVDYEGELRFEDRNLTLGMRISLLRDRHAGNDEGEPLGLAVCVRDLTRSKEYEKLKSDMISLMSHELRTPLTSINGFAELLTLDDTIPEQAREFVTIIANESQRLSRMINTFLAVTQLQRKDKQEVLKIPLRLDEVVRETILTLQPVAKKKRIRLVEQPAQRLPPVAADKSLITQAVKNLVNNAIKYSPERTTVTVSTALEAEAVRVSVEDRGFGIPAESKDRVWEKFYRVVRDGQEKDEESTGLGLSFVREVVEQHGGRVNLNSEEGRGSVFSFTLPRL